MEQSAKDYAIGISLGLTSLFGIVAVGLNDSGIPFPAIELGMEAALVTTVASACSAMALAVGTLHAATIGESTSKRIFTSGSAVVATGLAGIGTIAYNMV